MAAANFHCILRTVCKEGSRKVEGNPIAANAGYLGTDEISFTMNFSKGGSTVIAQYYQFLRLGFQGYQRIMLNLMQVAERLRTGISETGAAIAQAWPL